jgi:hypothetical protein
MNAEELITILRRGEGPQVEFKSDFPKQADDISKEMAALANSGGGVLLIGVADDGSLPGVANADQVADRLAGFARILRVAPEIDKFQISKKVFIVYAKIYPCPPSFFRDRIYHRVGSSSEACTNHEQLEKILKSHAAAAETKSPLIIQRRRPVWSGYWFVNVGEGAHRNWDDNRAYGFISAGGGAKYSNFLKRLKIGDKIFAYMTKLGYVGFGEVTREAVMIRDFLVDEEGSKSLLDLPLKAIHAGVNSASPELSEWAIGVKWIRSFSAENAKRFKGIFANQNIVCELKHPETVDFLKREFGIAD